MTAWGGWPQQGAALAQVRTSDGLRLWYLDGMPGEQLSAYSMPPTATFGRFSAQVRTLSTPGPKCLSEAGLVGPGWPIAWTPSGPTGGFFRGSARGQGERPTPIKGYTVCRGHDHIDGRYAHSCANIDAIWRYGSCRRAVLFRTVIPRRQPRPGRWISWTAATAHRMWGHCSRQRAAAWARMFTARSSAAGISRSAVHAVRRCASTSVKQRCAPRQVGPTVQDRPSCFDHIGREANRAS